jgi:hypothetical protein
MTYAIKLERGHARIINTANGSTVRTISGPFTQGTDGKPSDGGSFFDFMGFCGSVVFPGCPEWQVATGVFVGNPSEIPAFCPE